MCSTKCIDCSLMCVLTFSWISAHKDFPIITGNAFLISIKWCENGVFSMLHVKAIVGRIGRSLQHSYVRYFSLLLLLLKLSVQCSQRFLTGILDWLQQLLQLPGANSWRSFYRDNHLIHRQINVKTSIRLT